ncbi:MAG: ABC transporter ATP-binding protein [Gammaproteobacteria bacterium]|nr:ABC transporter ATP-binding protein [Gammaproteobacteria bacterium]|tara:strand:- start:5212 stop:5922 length:711 start_codon:yes stop_codon:yes gene_type:complete
MIKTKSLKRAVDSKVLFNNIDLELPSNQITGLLGANGAGKTSLFRAIAGLSSIDSGELTFFDEDLLDMTLEQRATAGLSYVPQENSLFEDLTLLENLMAVIELKFGNITDKKINETESLLKKMNLSEKRDTKAKNLSGGEKRKTEILRAILLESKFILLDEPFAGVDPISVEEINKILKDLKRNVGIFISDHNFRDVINVCDLIILLNQGEVLMQGTPDEVKNDPIAKKFYFGELN